MSNLVSIPKTDTVHFDEKKIELIRKTVANQLTPNEFELFISIAKARGLDPILGQIHAVVRGQGDKAKVNFQVGIDGFRLIAARTGEFAGRDETRFEYKSGTHHPDKAKVTVYRFVNGQKCSWTASAKWDEYYPGETMGFMWKKLPETMLEKCAEAKALRMAFPNDLSGLYVNEEMDQAQAPTQQREVKPAQVIEDDIEELAHDPGQYVFTFGKFKGMRLKEIPYSDLDGYCNYIVSKAKADGKAITGVVKEALEFSEAYLKSLEINR